MANVMVTTWALGCVSRLITGRKKHSHNKLNPPTPVGIGRMGQQDEKSDIQSLLWNGDSPSSLALLQSVNRFAASPG